MLYKLIRFMLRLCIFLFLIINTCFAQNLNMSKEVALVLQKQIKQQAAWALQQQPVTVTAAYSLRSAGGKHDFYSEGDYWWPNPLSTDSPYIQRDGLTNPDNFV